MKTQGQQKSCKVAEGPVAHMATDIVERGGSHLEANFFCGSCLIYSSVVKENIIQGCTGGDGSKYIFIHIHLKLLSVSKICVLASVGCDDLMAELSVQLCLPCNK